MKPFTREKSIFIKRILAAQIAACALTTGAAIAADGSSSQMSSASASQTAPEFKYLDANDDKNVDWSELHAAYGEELAQLAWNEKQVISRFDNNKDDQLSSSEYSQFTQSLAQEMTDKARADVSGQATAAESGEQQNRTARSGSDNAQSTGRATPAVAATGEQSSSSSAGARGESPDQAQASATSGADRSSDSATANNTAQTSESQTNNIEDIQLSDNIEDIQLSDNYLDNSDVENMESREQQNTAVRGETRNSQPSTMQTTAGTQVMPNQDTNVNDLQADGQQSSAEGSPSVDRNVVATPDTGERSLSARDAETRGADASGPAGETEMTRSAASQQDTDEHHAMNPSSPRATTGSSAQNQQATAANTDAAQPGSNPQAREGNQSASQLEPVVTTTIVAVFPDQEIPVSEIEDREVINAEGDSVGEVEEVIINGEGVVTGIVVGIGGFLDIGDKDVFVNIADVTLSGEQVVWRTNMSEDALKNLPEYSRESYSAL